MCPGPGRSSSPRRRRRKPAWQAAPRPAENGPVAAAPAEGSPLGDGPAEGGPLVDGPAGGGPVVDGPVGLTETRRLVGATGSLKAGTPGTRKTGGGRAGSR